jgi:hypothetical protein
VAARLTVFGQLRFKFIPQSFYIEIGDLAILTGVADREMQTPPGRLGNASR